MTTRFGECIARVKLELTDFRTLDQSQSQVAHQRQTQIVRLLKATREKIDAPVWILQQKEPFGTIILQNPTFIRLFIFRYCIGRQTAQFETRLSMQKNYRYCTTGK